MSTTPPVAPSKLSSRLRTRFGTLARDVRGQLETARGFFSGDLSGQLGKAAVLLKHREDHAQLHSAMIHFRYCLALIMSHRLGLTQKLKQGPLSADEAAAVGGIRPRAAELLLRALESEGVVSREGERFRMTEFADTFLTRGGPFSYAPFVELLATYTSGFEEVLDGLRTGTVAERMDVFRDAEGADAFLEALNRYLDNAGRELLSKVQLPEVKSLIVGSMGVSFSAHVLQRYPEAKVTYGCLPHLVRRIPALRTSYGVDATRVTGMHGHGGDPSADRWGDEAFDLVFLTKKMVLDPEQQVGARFAKKAFEVLNPGGAAIFWEAIYEDEGPTPMARAMESLLDLGVCPTGCVWTRRTITELLRGLGYVSIEVVPCLGGETSFVVARKP